MSGVEEMTDWTDSRTVCREDVVGDSETQGTALFDFGDNDGYLLTAVLSLKEAKTFILVRLSGEAHSLCT